MLEHETSPSRLTERIRMWILHWIAGSDYVVMHESVLLHWRRNADLGQAIRKAFGDVDGQTVRRRSDWAEAQVSLADNDGRLTVALVFEAIARIFRMEEGRDGQAGD